MNESLRERPDCHQSKSLILTIHIGMGVMTIDHMLFEKGTPATPTHSYMHTYSLSMWSNYPNSIPEKNQTPCTIQFYLDTLGT